LYKIDIATFVMIVKVIDNRDKSQESASIAVE